jgi:peptidoglycan/xylan/chitin deacetylase (PgdA/CDA1 family)
MKNFLFLFLIGLLVYANCLSKTDLQKKEIFFNQRLAKKETQKKTEATAAQILRKPEVPILCYHRIRNILPNDGENTKTYSVTPDNFAQQMKTLSENGFHSISPSQLYEYLVHDGNLPPKPILLTFDDTREEHYRLAAPEMTKYDFKGVFFIMTVSINRPGYLTKVQIKKLSDNGHTIGAHTWDHHLVTKYTGTDWTIQLTKPKKQLEVITGKAVDFFAYPSGIWNPAAITQLKNKNYQLAFILSNKRDSIAPQYTIRRLIVAGTWSTDRMLKAMQSTFNK